MSDLPRTKVCCHCGRVFVRDSRNTWAYWAKAKYCSRDCAGAAIASEKRAKRPAREEAFQRWFDRGDGCWEWKGAIDRDGYGIFSYARKSSRAARVALELDGRTPADDEYACHHCDNPRCVRPDHLYAGTPTENVQDMLRRGRGNQRGRSTTILNEEKVRQIRRTAGTQREVGKLFGVSGGTIGAIRRGDIWRDVQ